MNHSKLITLLLPVLVLSLPNGIGAAPFAYISNSGGSSNSVSKIDTATNTIAATVSAGTYPYGVAVSPDGKRVYVTNLTTSTVSVIDTTTNTVTATVSVGTSPRGIAVSPDGTKVYVANNYSGASGNSVMEIDTATNTVTAKMAMVQPVGIAVSPDGKWLYVSKDTGLSQGNDKVFVFSTDTHALTTSVEVGRHPAGIAISPDGKRVYVANNWSDSVSVIDTVSNSVLIDVPVGTYPLGVAVSSDGAHVFVTNSMGSGGNTVSVIHTATNTATAKVNVGVYPIGVAVTPDGSKVFVANRDSNSVSVIATATNTVAATVPAGKSPVAFGQFIQPKVLPTEESTSAFVPIVLTASGVNNSFFTSEMTLVNKGVLDAIVELTYTGAASLGGGSGVASLTISGGRQMLIPDVISYLKSLGIPLPDSGNRGGTLAVRFSGLSSSSDAAVVVRTTTPVSSGRAGLAYAGIPAGRLLSGISYICGLRQNSTDRSNVAVENAGRASEGSITLRLTVFSGDPSRSSSQVLSDIDLSPGGFYQISGVLQQFGITNGYVKVERVSGTAPYYAYGVINDQANSDGSFIPPIPESLLLGKSGLTLPVIVEAGQFQSEFILTNFSSTAKKVDFVFSSDTIQGVDNTVYFNTTIHPSEQMIIPNFIQYLRSSIFGAAFPSGSTYASPLLATVEGGDVSGISLSARTAAPGGGGQFGLFYSATPYGEASGNSAWLYGLQQNTQNRTNLAIVNTGENGSTPDGFTIELYNGETGEKIRTIENISVASHRLNQINAILSQYAPGVSHGYACVNRVGGVNPFITYAVINDGGQPGQRTGDGAYISSTP